MGERENGNDWFSKKGKRKGHTVRHLRMYIKEGHRKTQSAKRWPVQAGGEKRVTSWVRGHRANSKGKECEGQEESEEGRGGEKKEKGA